MGGRESRLKGTDNNTGHREQRNVSLWPSLPNRQKDQAWTQLIPGLKIIFKRILIIIIIILEGRNKQLTNKHKMF